MPIPESGCWIWDGATNAKGYGIAQGGLAHRLSYEAYVGPISPGMNVCHRCDVRCCVNPSHLFIGTQADNVRDMCAKGRRSEKWRARPGEAHHAAKLCLGDVLLMRALAMSDLSYTTKQLSNVFSISETQVRRILRGDRWKCAA